MYKRQLIHEATYNTILVKERRALHRRMAEILSARPDATATALAHHWLEGEDVYKRQWISCNASNATASGSF